MKKEKKVRAYQRRTKSGKTVTVRAHTASYEAAEKAKEAAKKKGAGDEIAERKKKNWELPMDEFLKKLKEERAQRREDEEPMKVEDEKPKKKSEKTEKKTPAKKTTKKRTVGTGTNGPEPKKKTTTKKTSTKEDASEPAFTRDEFKEWYRGTGSAADKKVAKALRKQLGRSGYRKFEDEAIDNYTSRGHLAMFKRVSGGSSTSAKTKSSLVTKKETSSDLRARADKMDADAKRAAIVKKLGSNKFRTIKDININVVKPNTRSAQLKGTLYVSSDRTKAYYEGSDGKLKKATKSILDRYVNKESKKRSVGTGTNGPEPKATKPKSEAEWIKWAKSTGKWVFKKNGDVHYRDSTGKAAWKISDPIKAFKRAYAENSRMDAPLTRTSTTGKPMASSVNGYKALMSKATTVAKRKAILADFEAHYTPKEVSAIKKKHVLNIPDTKENAKKIKALYKDAGYDHEYGFSSKKGQPGTHNFYWTGYDKKSAKVYDRYNDDYAAIASSRKKKK